MHRPVLALINPIMLTMSSSALTIQCGLAERVCQYLSHCSVRYCFQKPFNPLSADLDELFKSWVRPDRGQGQLIRYAVALYA